MICIGTIVKSHKTSGHFLCQLFNPLSPDRGQGAHRLSSLKQIELRQPKRTGQQQASPNRTLQIEEMQLIHCDSLGRTTNLLLKCSQWQQPEQITPFHGWELWTSSQYAAHCGEDEFLYCEMIGAEIYSLCSDTPNGQNPQVEKLLLGRVDNLVEGGSQLLLEIHLDPQRYPQKKLTNQAARKLYLPFHSSIIGQVQRLTGEANTQNQLGDQSSSRPSPALSMEVLSLEYFESLIDLRT